MHNQTEVERDDRQRRDRRDRRHERERKSLNPHIPQRVVFGYDRTVLADERVKKMEVGDFVIRDENGPSTYSLFTMWIPGGRKGPTLLTEVMTRSRDGKTAHVNLYNEDAEKVHVLVVC